MPDLAIMAIAQQIRKADYRGDFYLSLEEAMKLIEDFGRQEYLRGCRNGTNHPWHEDMGR